MPPVWSESVTALFIGVVSHEGSRFAVSQSGEGLAHRLAGRCREAGLRVAVVVNTDDLHDPAVVAVTEATVQASLTEQLRLDRQWADYLDRPRRLRWWGVHALRWIHRAGQKVRSPGPAMITRLLNIELSHLDLLRAGLNDDADWLLILEDDASTSDLDDCAAGLAALMTERASAATPAFVNVSQSFALSELGIEHLLNPAPALTWHGAIPRTVLAASRPVTNTVCAILYRASFAQVLVTTLDGLPVEPVVPIDWKLNAALMRLFRDRQLASGDCWLVDPAPIEQLSMRRAA